MSTTFKVFSKTADFPTFRELIELSTEKLHLYLTDYGLKHLPQIIVTLRKIEPDVECPTNLDEACKWNEDQYAWFQVSPVPGGTDAYFKKLNTDLRQNLLEDFRAYSKNKSQLEFMMPSLDIGHYWVFRRSAGQSAIINIAYGLIAASLAQLTSGFIYSFDGAWDLDRFPATPKDFFQWYFRPECTLNSEFAKWSRKCIDLLPQELSF